MENVAIVKYLLLLLTAPIWWPVLKQIWLEVNRMLADDGGVFGRAPTEPELRRVRRELDDLGDPLVNEPIPTEAERRAGRHRFRGAREAQAGSSAGRRRSGAGAERRGGASPRKTGFR